MAFFTGTGLADLTLAASGPDVSIDQDDTTCTPVLAPGASCVVVVDFLATTIGIRSNAVTISGGGTTGKVVTVSITANVVTGVFLVIDPSTPQGGSAIAGQTSEPTTFVVANRGDTTSELLSVAVTGENAAEFLATSTCTTLASLASCTVSVVFQPALCSGPRETATLEVTDTAASAPAVAVPLIGMVTPQLYTFGITSTTSDLGPVPVGGTGAPIVFTVTNHGCESTTGALMVRVLGSEFVITNDSCTGASLATGESCAVSVALQPTSAGPKEAVLWVNGAITGAGTKTITGTGLAD